MLLLLTACAAPSADRPGGCDALPDLAKAEAATRQYADVSVALADGYSPQPDCDADEDGAAMGIHYVRVADSLDQALDVASPDIVLYVPDAGGVRMVGVEYVRPALLDGDFWFGSDPPTDGTFDPAPEMFCRPFDGPMEGHVAGQPWHYDLHVWLYSANPDGTFAQYNPSESCGG